MPDSALPPHLRETKHWDYPKWFRWIPRAWTSFDWGAPKKILGNQEEKRLHSGSGGWAPAPIGEANSWQLSYYPDAPWWAKVTGLALYMAYSGRRGEDGKFRHFRVGSRWDDVDSYTTILSAASRKYSGGDEQDTSTGGEK